MWQGRGLRLSGEEIPDMDEETRTMMSEVSSKSGVLEETSRSDPGVFLSSAIEQDR